MNQAVTGAQERLLVLVTQHQNQRCQQILQEAGQQAKVMIETAKRTAKQQIEHALKTEEIRRETALKNVRAQYASELRHSRLSRTRDLLDRGWILFASALLKRWQEPETRREWLVSLIHQSTRLLPVASWFIEHPPQWDSNEWLILHTQLYPDGQEKPLFKSDTQIQAGLRVGCRGAWLDGTQNGIMANRQEIEAQLLARLQSGLSQPHEEGL